MAMAAALSTLVPQRADRLLLAAVGLCAVAAVFGAYGLPGLWLHWLGKPLATVGLLLFAARGRSAAPRYRGGVLAGLALSLLGDVLLMWPRDLFAAGLGAFLLAHFAYITAFTADTPLAARQGPFLAYAALAGVLSWLLWPGIPSALHLPVLLYVAALSAMAAQAAVRARVVATPGARCGKPTLPIPMCAPCATSTNSIALTWAGTRCATRSRPASSTSTPLRSTSCRLNRPTRH